MKLTTEYVSISNDRYQVAVIRRRGKHMFALLGHQRVTVNEVKVRSVRNLAEKRVVRPVGNFVPADMWQPQVAPERVQSFDPAGNEAESPCRATLIAGRGKHLHPKAYTQE